MFGNIWNYLGIFVALFMMAQGAFSYICPQRMLYNPTPEKTAKIKQLGFILCLLGAVLLAMRLT